ncbi:MAG: hypothetical protein ACE5G2_13790 [Candidatus Krumholzibacteriia bacterium]
MIEDRPLPSASESCLSRPYASSQKGGTLIAEDVRDLATHERHLEAPEGYRPSRCLRCGAKVHIHDLRPRQLLADPAVATEVMRFRCADRKECGAAWQVLPAFLARHLRRSWSVVESALEPPARSRVPARTRRRWRARLASSARLLVATLTATAESTCSSIGTAVGLDGSRLDLVRCYRAQTRPAQDACFAELAGLLHRLSPGVRLM